MQLEENSKGMLRQFFLKGTERCNTGYVISKSAVAKVNIVLIEISRQLGLLFLLRHFMEAGI